MKQGLLSLILVMAFTVTVACTKKQEPAPLKQARVSATNAYEKYFGPPPTTDKGSCYAFVIYFPSAKEPGKVVPFPFFTFDEGSIKKVALERLLSGMEVGSYKGEMLQPFAPGTRILGVTEQQGAVAVNFSREILASKADDAVEGAMLDAIALTLSQFSGVKEVRVQVEGKASGVVVGKDVGKFSGHGGLDKQPLTPKETAVMKPSKPRLLSVTATKEKGAKEVEEVNAFFDRPVDIKELKMTNREGKRFAGEVFHSVFDMAAVLKPKEPSLYKAGMAVKVRWKVVDKLGRVAEGDEEMPLEVKEH
jgi:spore germination protein GerM